MGFKQIFWGTVFLFDFRINGYDILPDFIGYILITAGLTTVMHLNKKFEYARIFSTILIIPSVFTIYEGGNLEISSISQIFEVAYASFILLSGFLITILFLFYVYFLYTGIQEEATKIPDMDLANKAKLVFVFILITSISSYIAIILPLLFIPIFILSVIIIVLSLLTLASASNVIEGR